ncbi:MAG: YaaL family protein [Eubacterium sp.]|nr:YaaL family protein [Eubacterium sp.]
MKRKKKDSVYQIREQLKQEIETLQQSLETANSNFDNVSDPDLVDSYIYELNALSFRYKYLLRQMREL